MLGGVERETRGAMCTRVSLTYGEDEPCLNIHPVTEAKWVRVRVKYYINLLKTKIPFGLNVIQT